MTRTFLRWMPVLLILLLLTLVAEPAGVHVNAAASLSPGRVLAPISPTGDLSVSDWSGIRQEYERHRHEVKPVAGQPAVWRARNPGQQWTTRFDGRGFEVEPDAGGWIWGLELRSYGVMGHETPVGTDADVRVDGSRVTYAWDATLEEWFINDRQGLEHGYTLKGRPGEGEGPLVLELGVRGDLLPEIYTDGRGVAFENAESNQIVRYAGLTVIDADDRLVPAWFEAAGEAVHLVVRDDGAQYPLTVDPVAQQVYLKASNTDADDNFGESVAVSGDTVVVGARGEDSNATGVDGNQTDNSAASVLSQWFAA